MELISLATAQDEHERQADVAVLPIGSFEQHGSHLPLATDTIVASTIAKRIATDYNLMLLPPVTVSCSHEHAGILTGTVSISATTLYAIVTDIAKSLNAGGVHRLVIVSGHGGNYVLSNVVQESNVMPCRRMLLFPGGDAWNQARADAGCATTGHDDMHGGELETSILLSEYPEAVRQGWETADHDAKRRPHLLTLGMAGYTTSGIIGSPSLASASKGQRLLNSLSRQFAEYLDVLQDKRNP